MDMHAILIVDDDFMVLNAMKRVFKGTVFTIRLPVISVEREKTIREGVKWVRP
jgi:hypothetical protein